MSFIAKTDRVRTRSSLDLMTEVTHGHSGASLVSHTGLVNRVPSSASEAVSSFINPRVQSPLSRKNVWGLYCMYAIVGLVNGYVMYLVQTPLCNYVFGPSGAPGRATLSQCGICTSVAQMPWNFKVFYGLLLDRFGLFGTRRRGWILMGWGLALCILAYMAFAVDSMVAKGAEGFSQYLILWLVITFFYVFSDVAGDGMTIEMSKFEPEETRGYILTTGQMVRFLASCVILLYGMLGMSGKDYMGAGSESKGALTFPFEVSLFWSHAGVVLMCVPLYILMILWLRDPPLQEDAEQHHSVGDSIKVLWSTLKTKVMLALLAFSLMNMALASLINPAQNAITEIANPSPAQISIGNLTGQVLFLIGVSIFRTYFMDKNWRITFCWTTVMLSLNQVFMIMIIYNSFGIGRNGWFFALGNNLLNIVQGITQVLSSLAIVEISPPGHEASVYEFLTTMHNAGITLNQNLGNAFMSMLGVSSFDPEAYNKAGPGSAYQDMYNSRMANATWLTMVFNIVGALIVMWFCPKNKVHTREWLENRWWHTVSVGLVCAVVGGCALAISLIASIFPLIPATACLKIVGGKGC